MSEPAVQLNLPIVDPVSQARELFPVGTRVCVSDVGKVRYPHDMNIWCEAQWMKGRIVIWVRDVSTNHPPECVPIEAVERIY